MITKKSNQTSKLRVCPIFGDLGMSVQLIRSNILRQIFSGDSKAYWTIFVWMVQVKVEMLALLSRSIFRFNHGRHTTGILTTIWTISMVMAFNMGEFIGYVLSTLPFIAPLFLIPLEWVQIEGILWMQTTSQTLSIWVGVFTIFQVVHVVRIYLEIGNTSDHMKRGTSWLQAGFMRTKYLSEFTIQCFIEPILTALIGYGVFHITGDYVFFLIAVSSAFCLFVQEFLDGSYRYYHTRY